MGDSACSSRATKKIGEGVCATGLLRLEHIDASESPPAAHCFLSENYLKDREVKVFVEPHRQQCRVRVLRLLRSGRRPRPCLSQCPRALVVVQALLERGYRRDELQFCPNGALCVVFMGCRIAKISEYAIAHVFGDECAKAAEDPYVFCLDLIEEPQRRGDREHLSAQLPGIIATWASQVTCPRRDIAIVVGDNLGPVRQ
jgi:hypothetical protein